MRVALIFFSFLVFFLFKCHFGFSQNLELRAGKTLFPGMYTSFRYEHRTNTEINLIGEVFSETSNKNNLRYRVYGINLLAQYSSDRENENTFSFNAGLGGSLQIENEPWVYKDWGIPKRLNYGLIAELASILTLSDAFAICVYAQQKYFFNKHLGTTHFLFGVGLSYHLSQ
jgi:hypothetical protein